MFSFDLRSGCQGLPRSAKQVKPTAESQFRLMVSSLASRFNGRPAHPQWPVAHRPSPNGRRKSPPSGEDFCHDVCEQVRAIDLQIPSSQFADAHRASPSGRSEAFGGIGYENCPGRRFKIVQIFRFNLGSTCHHTHQIYCFVLQFEFKSLVLVSQFGRCTSAFETILFAPFPLLLHIRRRKAVLSTYFLKFVAGC